jgi:hypothetical protein
MSMKLNTDVSKIIFAQEIARIMCQVDGPITPLFSLYDPMKLAIYMVKNDIFLPVEFVEHLNNDSEMVEFNENDIISDIRDSLDEIPEFKIFETLSHNRESNGDEYDKLSMAIYNIVLEAYHNVRRVRKIFSSSG